MATTTDYLTQLQTDKQTLVTNLVAKGVEADNSETFTTLVPKVADIQTEDEGKWKRPSNWYDLPTILSNAEPIVKDEITYYPKLALQYISTGDTTTLYCSLYVNYTISSGLRFLAKTSDGQEFMDTETMKTITITWNRTNEKDTRYVILYSTYAPTVHIQCSPPRDNTCIELVLGNCIVDGILNVGVNKTSFINVETLGTTTFTSTTNQFANYQNGNTKLQHLYLPTATVINSALGSSSLMDLDLPELTKLGSSATLSFPYYLCQRINLPKLQTNENVSFNDLRMLKEINLPSLTVMSANNFLANCYSAKIIDLSNLETFNNKASATPFSSAYNLEELKIKNNFKISGINLASSPLMLRTCLLDIINKLADVTEETGTTYTIILGTINLAKLTEEEIAVATAKGWTVS